MSAPTATTAPSPASARTVAGVSTIGVVGAGTMGAGIAQALATAGFAIVCRDPDSDALEQASQAVRGGRFGLDRAVDRGHLTAADADAAAARLVFTTALADLAGVDLVIESVPEDERLKAHVLREVADVVDPATVLATNTSGLSVDRLATALRDPSRLVGWHWASPAVLRPFAEVVRGARTSDRAVEVVVALARAAGRNPVVVGEDPDRWGFVANRVYAAMLAEAAAVVEAGLCTADEVDTLMTDCFGWPAGPFGTIAGAATGWEH